MKKIVTKGFVVPRDEKHAEWLKLGKELGEISLPIVDGEALNKLANLADLFQDGVVFIRIRENEIEIEYKPISITSSANTTSTSTTTSANISSSAGVGAGRGKTSNIEIIKVTRETRPVILREMARDGWKITFRGVEIVAEDIGYSVNGQHFTTLNAAVHSILESTGKVSHQVNAWDTIRLVKGDRVAKLEL